MKKLKIEQIQKIWDELNTHIFASRNMALEPAYHRRTRARNIHAYWADEWQAYYWPKAMQDLDTWYALIMHEMVHQWQTEYMNESDEDHHDRYFYDWQTAAHLYGIDFGGEQI